MKRFKYFLPLIATSLVLGFVVPAFASGGSWTPTGLMAAPHYVGTATLLQNGKVLVESGYSLSGVLDTSAELYDPATRSWSPTGSLPSGHDSASATLLKDGKVLVAGGHISSGAISDAELYDPTTGTWSKTGSLNTPRYYHTATLLPDGRVLVAGGYNPQPSIGILNSVEIYDPATGVWTSTSSPMSTARSNATATLLANGKVLVAGGVYGDTQGLSSAELFDPATGIWTPTGSMNSARYNHTATLLPDGRVLVAGGDSGKTASSGTYPVNAAELYDPATGIWSTTGSMNAAREMSTATLLPDGKVLVAGGSANNADTSILSSAELYDPTTGTWTLDTPMYNARMYHTATLLQDGTVLVAGGYDGNSVLTSAEIYNPAPSKPSNRPPVFAPIGNQTVLEAQTLTFTVSASDPDGDALTYSASNLPPGATFDPATHVFTRTPTYGQAGNYTDVEFIVTDSGTPMQLDDQPITITVGHTNRLPVFTQIGSQLGSTTVPLSFSVNATDPDGDAVVLSALNLPVSASFSPSTKVFSWTPAYNQAGVYTMTFVATDNGTPVAALPPWMS